jgi:acetyl-CoA C-acetyltransferase
MTKNSRKAAVVGVATAKMQKNMPMTIRDVAHRLIREAIEDAGITKDDVDGLFVTPSNMGALPSFMFADYLADYLGMPTRSLAMVESGGATATLAAKYAINELRLDQARFCVVFAIDRRATARLSTEPEHFIRGSITQMLNIYGAYEGPYGLGAPIPLYAMSAQRYMHEYGVAAEDIAQVPVVLRENASKNPDAMYREPITREDVLASHMISPPIHLLECSAFCFGAAAIVLASPEAAGETKRDPVWITGIGESHHPSHFIPQWASITTFESVVKAGKACFEDAGRKPSDVDIAEVYGVFAATELMLYEDLGFFEKGKAAHAVLDGRTSPGEEIPMNLSGGRLSLGHPPGATPLYELVEIVHQLRGEAGERQVKDPGIGLIQSEHGMLNGAVVMLFER